MKISLLLRHRRQMVPVFVVGLLSLLGAAWYTGSTSAQDAKKTGGADAAQAVPVIAVPARSGPFKIYQDALGTVTPLNATVVRSRVEGYLVSIAFEEGTMVKTGQILAQIDSQPFEVQNTLAQMQLNRAQALLETARATLERYRTLLAQNSISRQQVDTQESLVRQYEATAQAEQAAFENAQRQLAYTRISAPISGRVGLRQASPGNVVHPSDANGITSITQLQPIGVVFPIQEDALPRVLQRMRGGKTITVDVYDRSGKEKLGQGRLRAVDNQIDPSTGTIKLKAEFKNSESTLFPNQFVNVKMLIDTRPKAIQVPTAAIQHGVSGTFVYVVKADQTVAVTPVKIGPAQGDTTVIEDGISAGAMIVVEGADRLRDGAPVEQIKRDSTAAPAIPDKSNP